MRGGSLLCAALLYACVLGGCGAVHPSKYYQLTVPTDAPRAPAANRYPATLMLAPIMASHLYREDHIVYSDNGQYMGEYQYQRWAQPPTEMIREVLLRDLRVSNRFQGVYVWGSNLRGDYILRGRLYDFREVSGSSLTARVTLELELHATRTGAVLWTHFYTHDEPVARKDVPAVVAALDQNLQKGLAEFQVSLDDYFSTHPAVTTAPNQ